MELYKQLDPLGLKDYGKRWWSRLSRKEKTELIVTGIVAGSLGLGLFDMTVERGRQRAFVNDVSRLLNKQIHISIPIKIGSSSGNNFLGAPFNIEPSLTQRFRQVERHGRELTKFAFTTVGANVQLMPWGSNCPPILIGGSVTLGHRDIIRQTDKNATLVSFLFGIGNPPSVPTTPPEQNSVFRMLP